MRALTHTCAVEQQLQQLCEEQLELEAWQGKEGEDLDPDGSAAEAPPDSPLSSPTLSTRLSSRYSPSTPAAGTAGAAPEPPAMPQNMPWVSSPLCEQGVLKRRRRPRSGVGSPGSGAGTPGGPDSPDASESSPEPDMAQEDAAPGSSETDLGSGGGGGSTRWADECASDVRQEVLNDVEDYVDARIEDLKVRQPLSVASLGTPRPCFSDDSCRVSCTTFLTVPSAPPPLRPRVVRSSARSACLRWARPSLPWWIASDVSWPTSLPTSRTSPRPLRTPTGPASL